MRNRPTAPLRICLLSYRSNPHSGGQGVYIRHLSRALTDLGHSVEVLSGPPRLELDADIPIHRLPCLDLYNAEDPFRMPGLTELVHPLNLIEWLGVSTAGFPEPFTFGLRAYQYLRKNRARFDIIHDNQSLSYGVWGLGKWLPVVATIHHPITVDRDIAIANAPFFRLKLKQLRWHSFLNMQKRVARTLPRIITVSKSAEMDISRAFTVKRSRFTVVPNGIDIDKFHPMPEIERDQNRVIVTNSADIPLKGLSYLLRAAAIIRRRRPIQVVVVGALKKRSTIRKLISDLGLSPLVRFTGRIGQQEYVRQYARASVAVVPSLYEGFGLPAGEAMACGVPVVSTTGGALPEVVGDAGVLVPPADARALAGAIAELLDHPHRAGELAMAGYRRVHREFTWQKTAQKTVAVYREALRDHRRF
jgi:MMP alpha-(1->4)-mannosyltransferase